MNLLLDACALIALARGELSESARKALQTAPEATISPVTVWELAIKMKAGKLQLPSAPLAWVLALAERHTLQLSSPGLDASLLCSAADLPLIHRDPFDRVLVATAHIRQLTVMTSDRIISTYPGVSTVW